MYVCGRSAKGIQDSEDEWPRSCIYHSSKSARRADIPSSFQSSFGTSVRLGLTFYGSDIKLFTWLWIFINRCSGVYFGMRSWLYLLQCILLSCIFHLQLQFLKPDNKMTYRSGQQRHCDMDGYFSSVRRPPGERVTQQCSFFLPFLWPCLVGDTESVVASPLFSVSLSFQLNGAWRCFALADMVENISKMCRELGKICF